MCSTCDVYAENGLTGGYFVRYKESLKNSAFSPSFSAFKAKFDKNFKIGISNK